MGKGKKEDLHLSYTRSVHVSFVRYVSSWCRARQDSIRWNDGIAIALMNGRPSVKEKRKDAKVKRELGRGFKKITLRKSARNEVNEMQHEGTRGLRTTQ